MNASPRTSPPSLGFPRPDVRLPLSGCIIKVWVFAAMVMLAWATRAVAQAPANDSFNGRLAVVGSTNSVTGTNVGASAEAGEPTYYGKAIAASVWWSWIAPDSGMAVVDTGGSDFDTVLAAYTGSRVDGLTLIGANDDAPGMSTSLLTFQAIQGTAYHFAVDGFRGATGRIQLSVRLPVTPKAPSFTRQPVAQHAVDGAGRNVTFSANVTGSHPLSFEWRKDGIRIPGATDSACTITNVTMTDVGDYQVVVRNSIGTAVSRPASLYVRARLTQDAFATPEVLVGQASSANRHNVGATLEAEEPLHGGVAAGASVWWSWTAPQNGLVRVDTAGSVNALGETLDTVLAVYVGDRLNALIPVASNNDEVPGLVRSSRLCFRARAAATYRIAVAGVVDRDGVPAVGDIRLNLDQGPDNDFFVNASPIPEGVCTVRDDNRGATLEASEPLHAGNAGGKSVWWSWMSPTNGYYVVDTVGSAIDTLLGVYTGANLGSLIKIGGDDNRIQGGASLVKFFAQGGTRFKFAVDGHATTNGAESGAIVLNINPAEGSNDDFVGRINISGRTNRLSASNVGASRETGEPNHGANQGGRSVWWTWTAPATGTVICSTRGSSIDTILAVYTGSRVGALTLVAENDDGDPADPSAGSEVRFKGQAGQVYQIAVDGYRNMDGTVAEGNIVLSLVQSEPSSKGGNDLFANRFPITGQTNVVSGLNISASKELGEPDHAGNVGGRSLWWSWVAPASGPVSITTQGSGFAALLAVYRGDSLAALNLLGEDQDTAGDGSSSVAFMAEQGIEYQIAVDGFNDGSGAESGDVILSLQRLPDGPLRANDDFVNATPIVAPFLDVKGSNFGATFETGELFHSGAVLGRSVWWSWIASADGPVVISTAGSRFDTILNVYIGDSLASLRLIAGNDDITPFDKQSEVAFEAVAGQTYRIAVDGYGDAMGSIALSVSPRPDLAGGPEVQRQPVDQTRFREGGGGGSKVVFRVEATGTPPLSYRWTRNGVDLPGATNEVLTLDRASNQDAGAYQVRIRNALGVVTSAAAQLTFVDAPFNDEFSRRVVIQGASASARGSILGATKQSGEPDHGGGKGGRSVWWRWVAPSSGPVEIHTFGSSVDTLLGVYEGNDVGALALVAQNDNVALGHSAASRVVFNAVAMREYQIAVDGHKIRTDSDGSVVLTVSQPPMVDSVPPSVTIAPPSTGLTRAGKVSYLVTYNDANFYQSTLLPSDVILRRTGSADGLVTVSGTGNTRLVTVFRITGDGTLGISIGAGTASDKAGNLAPTSSPSPVFDVDNKPPTVRISAPSGVPGSGTVEYTVTYGDRNFAGSTLRAEDVRLHTTGTVRGEVRVQVSGDTALVTIASITGTGSVGISVAAGTAVDKAGNLADAAGPSQTFTVLDVTAPTKPAAPRLLAASDTGVSESDRITAADELVFEGSGVTGDVMTLHDGIAVLGRTEVLAGKWSLAVTGMTQGDHDLRAVLTDSSGNSSPPSDPVRVRIDRTAPTVSHIPASTVGAGKTLDIPFVVGDSQTDPTELVVQVASSSPSLLPVSGLILSGTGDRRSLRVSPLVRLVAGSVDVTLTVKDLAGNTTTPTFRLVVQPPNRPPTLDVIPQQTVQAGSGARFVDLTGITAGVGEAQNLTIRAVSDNPALVADPLAFLTLPAGSGALVFVPAVSGSGRAIISVIVTDDGGTAFGGINSVTNRFEVDVKPAISDSPVRIQRIVRLSDGSLELTVDLPTGRQYLLQESVDLRSWATGSVFTPSASPNRVVVPGVPGAPVRFFRVLLNP